MELPDDLIGPILRFLSPVEWFRLRSVNRLFHDALCHIIARTFDRQLGSKELWTSLAKMPAATAAKLLTDLETTRLNAEGMISAGVLRADTLGTILGSRAQDLTHFDTHRATFDVGMTTALRNFFWDHHLPALQHIQFNADHMTGSSEYLYSDLIQSVFRSAPNLNSFVAWLLPVMTSLPLSREVVSHSRNLKGMVLRGVYAVCWRQMSLLLPKLNFLGLDMSFGTARGAEIEIDSVTLFSVTMPREPLAFLINELVHNSAMLRNLQCLMVITVWETNLTDIEGLLALLYLSRPRIAMFLMDNGPNSTLHYHRGPTSFIPFACDCTNFSCATNKPLKQNV